MKDALDAPQRLLAPRGDAVKGFVIILQCSAALAEGRGENQRDPPYFFYAMESEVVSIRHAWHSRVHVCNPRIRETDVGGWQI